MGLSRWRVGAAAWCVVAGAASAAPLPQLLIEPGTASVSGLSSGGFMAVQLHVAYSGTFAKGAGIVAGGPFYCAEGSIVNATGRCMTHSSAIPVSSLVTTTKNWASQGLIDPVSNLATSKVYLWSGTADNTVVPAVMNDLNTYYQALLPSSNIVYRNNVAAGHAMVTDDYGGTCSTTASPYVNDCNVDLAGAMLQQIYGPLNARNDGTLTGTFTEFDQTAYVSGHGMATTGWVYVPAACSGSTACRVHVVLHGCKQNTATVGDVYVKRTGYNRWADTNRLVMLYPQTSNAATNGCWDWWGYDNANYAKKSGPQMLAIKGMVDRLASGTGGTEPPPPPPPPSCTSFTASNYAHTTAGRAYASFGVTYAKGSNQNMGLWNVFTTTTLKQTATNYYVIGTCP